jgi:hypothetical protein
MEKCFFVFWRNIFENNADPGRSASLKFVPGPGDPSFETERFGLIWEGKLEEKSGPF